jgi:hypothetical protein
MILTMHLRDKHISKRMDFKGTVSDLIKTLSKRYNIKDNVLSDEYSILVDGNLAEPKTIVGETVAIIHTISGG